MTESLEVWLEEVHVADLEPHRSGLRCRYTEEAHDRWPQNSPVISCSLPLSRRAQTAEVFLRGLLPEGQALSALAARAEVAVTDTFALLARYGRDIAGALVISEGVPRPEHFGVARYSTETLANEVAGLDLNPLGVHDDSELSIAGLQNKMLLVRLEGGGWGRTLNGRPSTHILKVDSRSHPGLVRAEAHCLSLAHALGLTTIEPELATFGNEDCLIVSRFDRAASGDALRRVHQEDLCQATRRDPQANNGRGKYQSGGGGGPSFADAARLLDAYAEDPSAELARLLAVATYTMAIGNADAHGKNLALLHGQPGRVVLAPLYDTVATILWPKLRREAAMATNGRFSLLSCDRVDLVEEGISWALGRSAAGAVVTRTLEQMMDALDHDVIPPGRLHEVVRQRVEALLGGAVPGAPAS